jgi:hypothetical protein
MEAEVASCIFARERQRQPAPEQFHNDQPDSENLKHAGVKDYTWGSHAACLLVVALGHIFMLDSRAQSPSADAFNPVTDGSVYSLALQPDGRILVGGIFTTLGGPYTCQLSFTGACHAFSEFVFCQNQLSVRPN